MKHHRLILVTGATGCVGGQLIPYLLEQGYARVRGLRRLLLHVRVLTPRLSSYWVHWVTPISAAYACPLIEGLRREVVVTDRKADQLFPEIRPLCYQDAVDKTLSQLAPEYCVGTGSSAQDTAAPAVCNKSRSGLIVEIRQRQVQSQRAAAYRAVTELGVPNGWPCDMAWRLRGTIDRIIGGMGCAEPGQEQTTFGWEILLISSESSR